MSQADFKGAVFDLDGVLVETVDLHFAAWKRMFLEYKKEFTFQDYKEKVDGIPRLDGARAILTDLSEEELTEAASRKQKYYLELVHKEGVTVYKDSRDLMKELRNMHIKIAVISSSRSCPFILEKAGIAGDIDTQVSGNDTTEGKPEPQIFLMACEKLHLNPSECIAFEDAVLGVESAKRAGIVCVGVDRHNDPKRLGKADIVVKDFNQINYKGLLELFKK